MIIGEPGQLCVLVRAECHGARGGPQLIAALKHLIRRPFGDHEMSTQQAARPQDNGGAARGERTRDHLDSGEALIHGQPHELESRFRPRRRRCAGGR